MWRIIFIATVCISPFFPSTGDATSYECETDYRLEETRCRQLHPGYSDCPTLTGTQCLISHRYCSSTTLLGEIPEETIVHPHCPEGFSFGEYMEGCKRTVQHGDVTLMCAPSYHERDDACARAVAGMPVCQPDSDPDDDSCAPTSYPLTDQAHCSTGYQEDGDMCNLIAESTETTCPYGYEFSVSVDMCLSNESFEKILHCEQGVPEGNQCVETFTRPIEYPCPAGSVASSNKPLKSQWSCRMGVFDGSDCNNLRNVDPVLTCPPNFRPVSDGQSCESNNTVPAMFFEDVE